LAFTLHMSRPHHEPSRRKRALFALTVALVAASWASAARADEPQRVSLRHDLWIDIPVTLGLGAGVTVWTAVRSDVLPDRCRLCDGSPGEVNGLDGFFRDALLRPDVGPAKAASDILGYAAAPLSAAGLGAAIAAADDRLDEAPLNTLLVAEATVVSLTLTEGFKSVFLRERPYVHAATDEAVRKTALEQGEALVSFPSGHTSTTFALATAAGTIATMRGYRLAPLVWIAGVLIGTTTGYLRIAADRHYFTDVLAGAALGTASGISVPLLFHGPASSSRVARWMQGATISSAPVQGGRVVSLGWLF
jgi:membrane-associated phospholipid phosphatase